MESPTIRAKKKQFAKLIFTKDGVAQVINPYEVTIRKDASTQTSQEDFTQVKYFELVHNLLRFSEEVERKNLQLGVGPQDQIHL